MHDSCGAEMWFFQRGDSIPVVAVSVFLTAWGQNFAEPTNLQMRSRWCRSQALVGCVANTCNAHLPSCGTDLQTDDR